MRWVSKLSNYDFSWTIRPLRTISTHCISHTTQNTEHYHLPRLVLLGSFRRLYNTPRCGQDRTCWYGRDTCGVGWPNVGSWESSRISITSWDILWSDWPSHSTALGPRTRDSVCDEDRKSYRKSWGAGKLSSHCIFLTNYLHNSLLNFRPF